MTEPLISVIIPVYNVEKYLEKCVESVIRQTYRHLEIFLVDDGATDGSGRLCDALAERDDRIQVIHKKNGGLADARNAALDVMTGEYFVCVDSDDYVTDDYVEYLYDLICRYEADVSACQLKKTYSDTDTLDELPEAVEVFDGVTAMEHYLYQRKFTASAHCKMYKSAIFQKIRYPVGYYYEDMAVICKVLEKADRVAVSNLQKYYYLQRGDSIMGESFNPKKMHRIEIAEDIKRFAEEKYPGLLPAARARCFLAAVQTYREVPLEESNRKWIDAIWKEITTYRSGVLRDKRAKISHRVIALSTYSGKKSLKALGALYTKAN